MPRRYWVDCPERRAVADALAAAVAASLPWSTSATAALLVIWLIALIPTLNYAAIRRELVTAAGALPVVLWLVAAIGMLWADATLAERLGGLGSFHKLLVIPLLLAQFRRSPNGWWVLLAFLVASVTLLIVSAALVLLPGLSWRGKLEIGVPVKDYISQSGVFTLCIFGLLWAAFNDWQCKTRWRLAALALAVAFFADLIYVATARTAVVVVLVLALILVVRRFRWKGLVALLLLGSLFGSIAWYTSPYLRARVSSVGIELGQYFSDPATETSAGLRLEFWRKSLAFVAQAPLVGHGTGAIPKLFRDAATGGSGMAAVASKNPHNQTLGIAIQLGGLGVALLYALWLAHALLFREATLGAWIGLTVVVQNVVGSLFNSHLSDFSQGWIYVLLVGVCGGMVRGGTAAAVTLPRPWPIAPEADTTIASQRKLLV